MDALSSFIKDTYDLSHRKFSSVELCIIASEKDPSEWPEEILWPIGKPPISIFGHQQVAMDREKSIKLIEALEWTGLCSSLGEARKAIKNKGVRVNRKVVLDIGMVLTKNDVLPNLDVIVLERGKYNFGIIEMC